MTNVAWAEPGGSILMPCFWISARALVENRAASCSPFPSRIASKNTRTISLGSAGSTIWLWLGDPLTPALDGILPTAAGPLAAGSDLPPHPTNMANVSVAGRKSVFFIIVDFAPLLIGSRVFPCQTAMEIQILTCQRQDDLLCMQTS